MIADGLILLTMDLLVRVNRLKYCVFLLMSPTKSSADFSRHIYDRVGAEPV